ncbi:MAG: carboxypeptidase-like regulatory domain-containing protein [Bacteroidales bacterium]|jgi:hypothetical protein|nr:carboxypeptidase-like regulatory domain-containing protein [Bacteroidales bacterium]
MKKTYYYLTLFLTLGMVLNLKVYSQVIRGTVLDNETNRPVAFASIYYHSTFTGTIADESGNFGIASPGNKNMPLTISAIGYYSVTVTNYHHHTNLKIYLKPKVYEIEDAVIRARSLQRKRRRNLRIFREEFLGTTPNARACEIMNEEDITFNYDSDKDTLKAYAKKPIQLKNKALGYTITYFLDKFEYYKQSNAVFFSGNFIFREDLSQNAANRSYYLMNREQTFHGSRMHLIRVLSSGIQNHSGFTIQDTTHQTLRIKDLVYTDEHRHKFLLNKGKLYVEYKPYGHPGEYSIRRSIIEFLRDTVYIDESGFFNPGLKWGGDLGQQRIADWLPYEYLTND